VADLAGGDDKQHLYPLQRTPRRNDARTGLDCAHSYGWLRHLKLDDGLEVTKRTQDMQSRGNQSMMRTLMVRALSFSAVAALMFNQTVTPVVASDYRTPAPVAADGQMNARYLSLGIGKSIVVDLPRDIKDVLVADPKIANAVVRSSQRAYIIGAAVGQTNIVFFDTAGQQIAAYDIAVKRDLNGIRAALKATSRSRGSAKA
jgi:Flp pilus assembly secretin CpaC